MIQANVHSEKEKEGNKIRIPSFLNLKKKYLVSKEIPADEKKEEVNPETLQKTNNFSTIGFVDNILEEAVERQTSDIHIVPEQSMVRIRLRIDGILTDFRKELKTSQNEIISRIKILSGLRTDEHNAAQDGRFRFTTKAGKQIDVRVSVIPTYHGENVVMRLLSDNTTNYNLGNLGFNSNDIQLIHNALKRPYGMILVTGPTGSGKTTTLYSLLKFLNTKDVAIITIEDPIEYALEGISQIPVNSRSGLTFAHGLRSILRQDPNIIMVGEIRDAETAGIAVNTALTGHLVLSTLHTNDAATTLPRLLDLKIEQYLIASTVTLVIGQRLVRKICEHCKSTRNITEAEKSNLQTLFPNKDLPKSFAFGKGCKECSGSGFKGRVGIYEILTVTPPIREAILLKSSADKIKVLAKNSGMTPIIEDGYQKVISGVTTLEEILRIFYE